MLFILFLFEIKIFAKSQLSILTSNNSIAFLLINIVSFVLTSPKKNALE